MGFSRQEYWNGLPFPSPGNLPGPGIKPRSPTLQADSLPSELPGKPKKYQTRVGSQSLLQGIFPTQELNPGLLHRGEGTGIPLQYSCLENPMDRGVWWAAIHGVTKSRARLSDFPFTFHFYALEKVMATHSSVLAWRIPGTGEPGRLPSMGLHRVGHD